MEVATLKRSRNAVEQMATYLVRGYLTIGNPQGEKAKWMVNMRMAELGPLDGALFNA
jgi:hypothetical protein